MSLVLVDVGSVDNEENLVLLEAAQVCIVDCTSVIIRDDAVLGLAEFQGSDIAGYNMLEKSNAVRAFDQESSHVGDIEETAVASGVEMLRHYAGRILHGHVPSAEIHHCGSCSNMVVVQNRSLKFVHREPPQDQSPDKQKAQLSGQNESSCLKNCASVLCLRDSPVSGVAPSV